MLHTQETAGIDLVCDGELYRFDRFAAPDELWEGLQERFPELLNAA